MFTRFRITQILILLLAACSTAAALFWGYQRGLRTNLTEALAPELTRMEEENIQTSHKYCLMIDDSEKNEGNYRNSGLKDTLRHIRMESIRQMRLVSGGNPEELEAWGQELANIYASQLNGGSHPGVPDIFYQRTPPLPIEQKHLLMSWEKQTLDVLGFRLGVIYDYFSNLLFEIHTDTGQKDTLKEGDIYRCDIRTWVNRGIACSIDAQPGFVGETPYAISFILIPTDGLLAPGESSKQIPFALYAKPYRHSCLHTFQETQHFFTVVKKQPH